MDHKDDMEWLLRDKGLDEFPRLEKRDCGRKMIVIFKSHKSEWRIDKVNKELFLYSLFLTKQGLRTSKRKCNEVVDHIGTSCPGQKHQQVQKGIKQIIGGWVCEYLPNMMVARTNSQFRKSLSWYLP